MWRAYRSFGIRQPVSLIAESQRELSAAATAAYLHGALKFDQVFNQGDFLELEATFEEMLTRLLPLTPWGDLLVRAGSLPSGRMTALLQTVRRESTAAGQQGVRLPRDLPITTGDGWDRDDLWRLYWLVSQIWAVSPRWSVQRLLAIIMQGRERAERADELPLRTVGTNRAVFTTVYRSRVTVKADAAERVFTGDSSGVTWAVIDTGIYAQHPAFIRNNVSRIIKSYNVPAGIRAVRDQARAQRSKFSRLFTDTEWETFSAAAERAGANNAKSFTRSENDHGTHVAGILAGDLTDRNAMLPGFSYPRGAPTSAVGICPTVSVVDIRVFDDEGDAEELNVITALAFVQWLNRSQRLGNGRLIDGVNLSLAVPFAADQFACGWTPVCREADRCVNAGIVVVAAAGNAGFDPEDSQVFGTGVRLASITDPGNTESVITVGATDPVEPHRYGPISLSGRGPTADGRHKPDLLAPGAAVWAAVPGQRGLAPLSGTSMATPHVSGAAAILLARFPELKGQPGRVKALLCKHATDLERHRDFQGFGLLDVLRTLQGY